MSREKGDEAKKSREKGDDDPPVMGPSKVILIVVANI